jgi:two-component system, OmpR family, sensor histidine kinase VicK
MSSEHNDIKRIGDLSKDGVFIYNTNLGKFTYVNDIFADVFNTNTDELLKQPRLVLPFIRTEDADYLRHRFTDLVRDHCITNTEFRLHLSDGTIRHLCCDAYLLNDTFVAGFAKDVSKEKEHEDYIINYGAKKDTLLDMMTHNLSGPLYLSKHILHWVQHTYKDKTPIDISTQLKLIQSNTQECIDIIDDFLKTEHMESERIYVKKTRFDVLERIAATLEKIIVTNKNKRFRLITDLKNLNISTDSVKFFQIIHNLISNAIKFTHDNGEIDILVEERESSFVISVRDNGIGIPTELHDKLFAKNTPAGREGLNNERSSGMGLHIVQMLVGLLNGKVWFESNEAKGSMFSIELPKE